jgi:hypothetical protein
MSTYNFANGSIAGTRRSNQASPGDSNTMQIRRGFVDTTKQNLANADVAQCIAITAGEVVTQCWIRTITADATSNATIDVVIDGTTVVADHATGTANSIKSNAVPIHVGNSGYISLSPTNGVAIDAGVFEVCAVVTKSFSKL